MTRYPWAPLEALLSVETFEGEIIGRNTKRLARRLEVAARQVYRWREIGLSRDQAEAMAERAGWMGFEVWPSILDDAVAELERECAGDDCAVRFVPGRGGQRYCSRRCMMRAANARYVERHRETVLARARVNAARYYAENGDYVRARQRRYYAEKRAEAA